MSRWMPAPTQLVSGRINRSDCYCKSPSISLSISFESEILRRTAFTSVTSANTEINAPISWTSIMVISFNYRRSMEPAKSIPIGLHIHARQAVVFRPLMTRAQGIISRMLYKSLKIREIKGGLTSFATKLGAAKSGDSVILRLTPPDAKSSHEGKRSSGRKPPCSCLEFRELGPCQGTKSRCDLLTPMNEQV